MTQLTAFALRHSISQMWNWICNEPLTTSYGSQLTQAPKHPPELLCCRAEPASVALSPLCSPAAGLVRIFGRSVPPRSKVLETAPETPGTAQLPRPLPAQCAHFRGTPQQPAPP